MSVNEILEAIPNLTTEERAQVKALLDTLPSSPEQQVTEDELEDAFERELMTEGVLGEARPLPQDDPEFYGYRPVTATGKPVSEIIIEERR